MKFLTGDDTGILKWIKVEAQKVERFPGPRRRGDAAEKLLWLGPDSDRESRVAVAYASGTVEVRCVKDGSLLGSFKTSPGISCMQRLALNLLLVSQDGCAVILKNWFADEFPEQHFKDDPDVTKENGEQSVEEKSAETAGDDEERGIDRFVLPGPISSAELEPVPGSQRLAFGGGENDLKIYDIAEKKITWRAKNFPDSILQIQVPIKFASVHWATCVAPKRSLLVVCTLESQVRVYDADLQRRALFEMVVGFMGGETTGGHTGADDVVRRPIKCSRVARTHDGKCSLFIGNNLGVMREYNLETLADCVTCPYKHGLKKHKIYAHRNLRMKRGYRDMMGGVRDMSIHENGKTMVAVGLGRFAHVYSTGKKIETSKIYLKQKLCSVLLSEEIPTKPEKSDSDDDASDATGLADDTGLAEGKDDIVQEGFSDDEALAENDGGDGNGSEQDAGDSEDSVENDAEPVAAKKRSRKRVASASQKGKNSGKSVSRKRARIAQG